MEHIYFKNFKLEKLATDKILDVQYLFNVAFNTELSVEDFKQKHQFCHGENKFIGYMAYDLASNEPAAYYAVYPAFMIYKGQKVLIAQSGDTMTNPKFQKQGLFVKLAELTYQYCYEVGIHAITGLPNNNSFPGFIKYLGFKEHDRFINLCLFENKFELSRITEYFKPFKRIHNRYTTTIIKFLSKKSDSFSNSNEFNPNLDYMLHDNLFFLLKKNTNNLFVSIENVKIWLRIEQNTIIIADLDLKPENINNLQKILSRLKIITILSGKRFINFSSTPNSYLYYYLLRHSHCQTEGYRFITRVLNKGISVDHLSLLACDADVF